MPLSCQLEIVVTNVIITSQQVYKCMTLHRISELYTQWFSVCLNITSKFRTIAIFENFVKQHND
jgi:hypothetical protein